MANAITLSPAPHVRCAHHAAVLRTVLNPGITLAVWTRPPPQRLVEVTEALAARAPFRRSAEDRPDRLGAVLVAGLPLNPCARTRLATDIARLARLFAALLGANAVHGRLEAIDGNACRLFHADHVGLRLLCTYAGPGTEWVPDAAVDRTKLGTNAAAVPNRAAVRHVPRFAVALLKGEAWPGNAGRGVVHRSPEASAARPRLLLCLDEPARF